MSGGLWTGLQVVVNKLVSLVGTVVMMYLLDPSDFGVAMLATSVLAMASLLPAFTLSDVLIARPLEIERLMGAASRICLLVTLVTVVLFLCASPWIASGFEEHRLLEACIIVAARPFVEWMLLGPQTRLRARLAFKEIASVDALTQTLATIGGISMAWAGCGYVSLLVPQIVFTGVRAWLLSRISGRVPDAIAAREPNTVSSSPLLRNYVLSGLGQYVHGGLLMATPLLIGNFDDETSVGLYTNAFNLSASINVVVAVSMGMVLQPIFAQMGTDRARQAAAFLRACRVIAAISMPVCMLQAVLAPAGFDLFLPARWSGAVGMTQVLCLGQMFYFPVNPAMGLLKAQGRFGAFFCWQTIQLVLAVASMVIVGKAVPDHAAILIVAVAAITPLLSSPVGVWLSVRGASTTRFGVAAVFVAPLIASSLCILPGLILCRSLVQPGTLLSVSELVLIPALALVTYPWLLRVLSPSCHADLLVLVARFRLHPR
jgi:O-antigen/teichoic acid export membrane protein